MELSLGKVAMKLFNLKTRNISWNNSGDNKMNNKIMSFGLTVLLASSTFLASDDSNNNSNSENFNIETMQLNMTMTGVYE